MSAVLHATAARGAHAPPGNGVAPSIRVMVVDDSVVVRGLVARWLAAEQDMSVVASLRTGREAIEQIHRANPDVVVLDIEMPEMDGLEALPLLMAAKPNLIVIMASALTRTGAEVSFKALALGASDYIPKPQTNREVTTSAEFRRALVDKIRHLGARRHKRPAASPPAAPHGNSAQPAVTVDVGRGVAAPASPLVMLRPWSTRPARALVVGSSTGGPQALNALLSGIGAVIDRAPVLIAQHMPPTFTTILAEHLSRASGRRVREAEDGEAVLPGRVYLAPGGRHMLIARRNGQPVIVLDDGPSENFCKPAVDPLFRSAATVFGSGVLAAILTGMGADGSHGAGDIVAAGGNVIAQDESTSVVWGMPGAAVNAGVCAAVLPIELIAPKVLRVFGGVMP